MPTIASGFGMRIQVNVRDEHPPPHVHVLGDGWEIRVLIGVAAVAHSPVWGRPSPREIALAVRFVTLHLERCNAAWEAIHG